MNAGELKKQLTIYAARAQSLELTRREITSQLDALARTEIIPQVRALLPARFSLDNRVEVQYRGESGSVPGQFSVDLRLLYDGKPIFHGRGVPTTPQLCEIQNNPRLKEIADQYGLLSITPHAEPVEVG